MAMLWIKALHVMAVVTFASGLLLASLLLGLLRTAPTPRLPQERRLLIAARHCDRWITTPALLLVWMLGLLMAVHAGWFGSRWLTGKLVLAGALSALHGVQAGMLHRLLDSAEPAPAWVRRAYAAALLAILGCVLLVVLKPG